MPAVVKVASEGKLDMVVAKRLLGDRAIEIAAQYDCAGRTKLRPRLEGFAKAAKHEPWLIIADLEDEYPCAPAMLDDWIPAIPTQMRFRVAVRMIEAWLLADRERMAEFLAVQLNAIPTAPDELVHAKTDIVNLARTSTSRDIIQALVPRPNSGKAQGPEYTAMLSKFTMERWRPREAAKKSPSLRRALAALDSW